MFPGQRTVPRSVHAADKERLCRTPVTAFDLHVLVSTDSSITDVLTCSTEAENGTRTFILYSGQAILYNNTHMRRYISLHLVFK